MCSEGVIFEQNELKDRVLEFRFKMHLMLKSTLNWVTLHFLIAAEIILLGLF